MTGRGARGEEDGRRGRKEENAWGKREFYSGQWGKPKRARRCRSFQWMQIIN